MGFKNHELFIKRHQGRFRGPFLEIGAKDYGSTVNLRAMFPGENYVGIDMAEGKGVDLVLDLTRPFEEIDGGPGRPPLRYRVLPQRDGALRAALPHG